MSEHTPGPWQVWYGGLDGDTYFTIGSKYGDVSGVVCDYAVPSPRPSAEVRANARLIAAAPDLLAACQAALPYVEQMPWPAPERVVDAVRAAVAKATGQGGAA